jgi:hypothetical protein
MFGFHVIEYTWWMRLLARSVHVGRLLWTSSMDPGLHK